MYTLRLEYLIVTWVPGSIKDWWFRKKFDFPRWATIWCAIYTISILYL